MPEIRKPDISMYFIARSVDGAVVHHGQVSSNLVMSTGQAVLEQFDNENDYLGALGNHANKFPPLPAMGESIEAGQAYEHNGGVIMARQSHIRTEHDPIAIPNLFAVYQIGGSNLDWIENEEVFVGTIRGYQGTLYKCIQAHQTLSNWTPPVTPALWQPYTPPNNTDEWASGVAYAVDDEVTYQGPTYRCLQAHTSQLGWEPPNVPALWLPV